MAKDTVGLVRGMADDATASMGVAKLLGDALGEIIAITNDPEVAKIVINTLKEASTIMSARQVMVEAEQVLETGQ